MEPEPRRPSERPGTPGLDVFKIAGQSISGFVHSFKTGDARRVRLPFTSRLEERLALYLEYHPHVRFLQRGDASPACTRAYDLATPLGTPYRITYVYDGQPHDYLPDFVGILVDGGLLIAEAGRASEKGQGRALIKADAARRLAHIKGGVYWIGTDLNLPERRHQNWLYLQARRQPLPAYPEIAAVLLPQWPSGEPRSVAEWVRHLGRRWSDAEVEAAVWKLAADAAAAGRLLVDLGEVELSLSTPLAFLDPAIPPLLPDPLPSELEMPAPDDRGPEPFEDEDVALDHRVGIPGPTFDASSLATTERQAHFHRNLTAVSAVLSGMRVRRVAQASGMGVSSLARLVRRTRELGQIACVPYATYHRARTVHPDLQQLIRQIYTQPIRPTVRAVAEDVRLKQLAAALSEREDRPIPPPSYGQVYDLIQAIAEAPVVAARSGLKHAPSERMSPKARLRCEPSPRLGQGRLTAL
jgi:transposase